MKNQYFGDTRDLFKYDLALHVLESTDLTRFTFIPMLTPDDTSTDGVLVDLSKGAAGTLNKPLFDFLEACTDEGRRDIRELEGFFSSTPYEILIYGDIFEGGSGSQYFHNLPVEWLRGSVIVLDPDNGMEIKSRRGNKWLRYDELHHVHDSMDDRSVALVFQFIPREDRNSFIPRIGREIAWRSGVEGPIHWISDKHIVFYAWSKGREDVGEIIEGYARGYRLLSGSI